MSQLPLTGSSHLGGNWTLEYQTGSIETNVGGSVKSRKETGMLPTMLSAQMATKAPRFLCTYLALQGYLESLKLIAT